MPAGFVVRGADSELQAHFIRNDVVFGTAMDRADRDDGGIERIELSADDGLQIDNNPRGDDDWIDRPLRSGAMASFAQDNDIDRVDIGLHLAAAIIDVP